MNELERIEESYYRRDHTGLPGNEKRNERFLKFADEERNRIFTRIIMDHFSRPLAELKLMEIGAGTGRNLGFFHELGFRFCNMQANELLSWRIETIKRQYPSVRVIEGDALAIDEVERFDIVLQSLVFTSILDPEFKRKLSIKMLRILNEGGIILWYDFIYNNPRNQDVRGIGRKEIRSLFPDQSIRFYRATLLPPLGRILGRFHPVVNRLCPMLRSHLVAVIMNTEWLI